jgi:FkbM family methyltransferase
VVLDVGGNVGAFARHAALAGAKMVVTIEPEQSNFECLLANTEGLPNVVAIRGCLGLEAGECDIWLSAGGRNPGNTSQTQRRGRFAQRVPVVALSEIMTRFRPESVKLDCEGAEYVIGRAALLPDHVRDVVAEVHISGFGVDRAQAFCQEYIAAGWRTTREPKITPTLWHTLGGWTR